MYRVRDVCIVFVTTSGVDVRVWFLSCPLSLSLDLKSSTLGCCIDCSMPVSCFIAYCLRLPLLNFSLLSSCSCLVSMCSLYITNRPTVFFEVSYWILTPNPLRKLSNFFNATTNFLQEMFDIWLEFLVSWPVYTGNNKPLEFKGQL